MEEATTTGAMAATSINNQALGSAKNTCELPAEEEHDKVISAEQEELFMRRFEEGYDLRTEEKPSRIINGKSAIAFRFIEPLTGMGSDYIGGIFTC